MGPAARIGPINLTHSQRKLSFFTALSELKYYHNRNIVLFSVFKGYNSKLTDKVGWLDWLVIEFWEEGEQGHIFDV